MSTTKSSPASIAEAATIHALLNCYDRDTDATERTEADAIGLSGDGTVLYCPLSALGVELAVELRYDSPTGRHLFALPVSLRGTDGWKPVSYTTVASCLCQQLATERDGVTRTDDLLGRIIQSCQNVARYAGAETEIPGLEPSFRAAEQSLTFGHPLHPTPKSRIGISPDEAPTFAPELGGSFQLSYVAADPSIVAHDSAWETAAPAWVRQQLDSSVLPDDDSIVIPMHPWQARRCRSQPAVEAAIEAGELSYLGQHGPDFYPTSSVRTLYSPEAPFMVKGSLHVEITNSLRTNKRPELERGVAITELLQTEFGDQLESRFPAFDIVRDPAYLTLDIGSGQESGFEVVLRENPFDESMTATPVVALCQDRPDSGHLGGQGDGARSLLSEVITSIADREDRSRAAVSLDWFDQYCDVLVRPVVWLLLEHGLGLEAHQQNTVLELEDGYPVGGYYRDNQGYYFAESTYEAIDSYLPGVGDRAQTICRDAVVDERIRYYLFCNNVFGVINAFGTAGLIEERRLLERLAEILSALTAFDRDTSTLLDELLEHPTLPCKANLLTRVHDMDELEGSIDAQSVYTQIDNPLWEVATQ